MSLSHYDAMPYQSNPFTQSQPLAFLPTSDGTSINAASVSNLRHENVLLNKIEAQILASLDGEKSREQLVAELIERAARREFTLMRDNVQLSDPAEIRLIVEKLLTDALQKFDRLALLVRLD